MIPIAFRLLPEQDLKSSLLLACQEREIDAACVLTCVGSLRRAVLRFAGQAETTIVDADFEIVSLVGTISRHGAHLHVSLSDRNGHMIGGHLFDGSLIRTTAEVVLGIIPDLLFTRQQDPQTGYRELHIQPKD
ncbi:MAG: PPC domain-containing DNA-binding protein [Gemmataceae bacterium]